MSTDREPRALLLNGTVGAGKTSTAGGRRLARVSGLAGEILQRWLE